MYMDPMDFNIPMYDYIYLHFFLVIGKYTWILWDMDPSFNIFHNKNPPVGHDQSSGTLLFLADRRFVVEWEMTLLVGGFNLY